MDDDVPGQSAAQGGLPSVDRRRSMTGNTAPGAVRTREKLIGAFHQAIRESDPRDMSVSALARAAGVNRTSFYEHFASPEDLAIHALSELFDVVSNADIAMRAEHAVTGAEASRRALHAFVSFVAAQRDSYARVLGPGGPPPPGADPRTPAQFLAGGVLGVVGAWLADPDPGMPTDQLADALVEC